MHFSPSLIVAILGTPYLALAQSGSSTGPNAFKVPMSGTYSATAGQALVLNWTPTTQGTVSLLLRSGNSGDLDQGETIASKIPNSGSYTWDVPSSAVRGSSYTIEIVDDSDPSQTNYTPPFVLNSNNIASSSAASSSGTATSSGLTTSTSGATSSSASSTGSSTASSTGSHSSSATGTMTSSASGSSSSQASSTSQQSGLVASGNPTPSQSHSNGGSARATVAAGMLGMIALGALAL